MAGNSYSRSCILCGSRSKLAEKCSFFYFPKNESIKKEWVTRCQLPEGTDVSSARLCSKHFQDDDYTPSSFCNESAAKRMRLKKHAVPSIFPNSSSSEVDKSKEYKKGTTARKIGEHGQYCMVCKRRTLRATKRLPKDKNEAAEWIHFFGIQSAIGNKDITKINVRICDKHFELTDPQENVHRKRSVLRLVQVPARDTESNEIVADSGSESNETVAQRPAASMNDPVPLRKESVAHIAEESTQLPIEQPVFEPVVHEEFATHTMEDFIAPSVEEQCKSPLKEPVEIPVTPSVGRDGSRANYAGRLIFPRYPNDIRTPHLSSPRSAKRCLQITKDVIAKQKYELVLTKQQLRRATKKIKNLEQIITHLRDQALLNEDMKESLMNDLPPVVADLAYRRLRGQKERYSRELRRFALTLHFYSPKAYDYVRKTFLNLIPHPAHIRKWCCTEDAKPGFNTEVMETIQKVHTTTKKNIVCNLVVDDMSIRDKIITKNGSARL